MSNFQAIATVTATLVYLLNQEVPVDVPATITAKPPDVIVDGPPYSGLNIFLYQVNLNQGFINRDQPARDSSGALVKRPRLALNLEYLLTATGDGNDDIQAHQILASAMRILNENPVLTSTLIQSAVSSTPEIQGGGSIPPSDLAYQIEQVKITPLQLKLDELTKLWSSFFQTNYRVSTAYEVTVILLDSQLTPKPSLPVLTTQVAVVPFSVPVIQSVDPQVLEAGPGATLTINGLNLSTAEAVVSVLINAVSVTPAPSDVTSTEISIVVPSAVTPGVQSVQVVQSMQLAPGQPALPFFESNVVPFVLAPAITTPEPISATPGGTLLLSFTPNVVEGQQIDFLIGDYSISILQNDLAAQVAGATTTTSGNNASGQDVLVVNETTGLVGGAAIVISPGEADEESAVVASVGVGSLTLTLPLAYTHPPGETVTATTATAKTSGTNNSGQNSLALTGTTGFAPGASVTIDPGGADQESVVVATVVGPTSVTLTTNLLYTHPTGEPVSVTISMSTVGINNSGQDVLAVDGTTGFTPGAAITINPGGDDQESATIASIAAGVSFTLGSPLTNTHPPGEPVSMTPYAGRLEVPIPSDIPPGTYLLRMRVDGAESLLQLDPAGNFASPTVVVT
jgi:hypothetical protein